MAPTCRLNDNRDPRRQHFSLTQSANGRRRCTVFIAAATARHETFCLLIRFVKPLAPFSSAQLCAGGGGEPTRTRVAQRAHLSLSGKLFGARLSAALLVVAVGPARSLFVPAHRLSVIADAAAAVNALASSRARARARRPSPPRCAALRNTKRQTARDLRAHFTALFECSRVGANCACWCNCYTGLSLYQL